MSRLLELLGVVALMSLGLGVAAAVALRREMARQEALPELPRPEAHS